MKQSAGILLYRMKGSKAEVMLVHPGGPFWAKKDEGAWTIPKGEFEDDENPLDAALREFREETGIELSGKFIQLSPVKQKSGKMVYAWALQADVDAAKIRSNTFEIEWPPRSGKKQAFPEIDCAEWFGIEEAKRKINHRQIALIEELARMLSKI